MKILVTGGSGLLGSELKNINHNIICCDRYTDIRDNNIFSKKLNEEMPDIVIHCAAITDSKYVEQNREEAILVNIVGTANVANWCIYNKRRMIYISTDYVYSGIMKHKHSETDPVKPENLYATTKLGGECSVQLVPNHLIIRTSFGASKFPYDTAFDDLIVSKDYVDVIAPMILNASKSDVIGILNIGTDSKSMYEYAFLRNPNIKRGYLKKESCNFSLNTNKYKQIFDK